MAHMVFSMSLVYGVGGKVGGWTVAGADLGACSRPVKCTYTPVHVWG